MLEIVTFGYGQPDGAPTAHVTFDLRTLFRDPHIDPAMRQLTGMDHAVLANVFRQPGFVEFVDAGARFLRSLVLQHGDVVAAVGCRGGRHRSVVAGRALHGRLRAVPGGAVLCHRDIGKPVLTS